VTSRSYAPTGGGGVGTYMRKKQKHILERTGHRLLQIVPGAVDRVVENGRHIWVEVAAGRCAAAPITASSCAPAPCARCWSITGPTSSNRCALGFALDRDPLC
jgi:hypothetical protein